MINGACLFVESTEFTINVLAATVLTSGTESVTLEGAMVTGLIIEATGLTMLPDLLVLAFPGVLLAVFFTVPLVIVLFPNTTGISFVVEFFDFSVLLVFFELVVLLAELWLLVADAFFKPLFSVVLLAD